MANRWMDERDRDWLDREGRDRYGQRRPDQAGGADRSGEDRSFHGGPVRGGFGGPVRGRDPVFGERETGASYGRGPGERLSSWAGGEARRFREDFRREVHGHRGLGPKGYKRADERISDDAHERLTDDTWLDARNIAISVSGGEVTLSGTVDHREAKHRAERLVEDITGVEHVQNNLRVDRGGVLTRPASGFGDSATEAGMGEAPAAPKKSN